MSLLPDIEEVPVLPLRDKVVYPDTVLNLRVGRDISIQALNQAMQDKKTGYILLLMQKNPGEDAPGEAGLYRVGTLARVFDRLNLHDGTVTVLMEGIKRCTVQEFRAKDTYLAAKVVLPETEVSVGDGAIIEALIRNLK